MNADAPENDRFRCPTCGATQAVSAECRRCKCDLSLVLAVRRQARMLHDDCLRHLRAGAHRSALACAVRRQELSPDETSRRLLAMVYLCLGKFPAALEIGEGSHVDD